MACTILFVFACLPLPLHFRFSLMSVSLYTSRSILSFYSVFFFTQFHLVFYHVCSLSSVYHRSFNQRSRYPLLAHVSGCLLSSAFQKEQLASAWTLVPPLVHCFLSCTHDLAFLSSLWRSSSVFSVCCMDFEASHFVLFTRLSSNSRSDNTKTSAPFADQAICAHVVF